MIPLPPHDPGLTTLDIALDGKAMTEILRDHLPAVRDASRRLTSCQPVYVRYKPDESCLVLYEVTIRQSAAAGGDAPVRMIPAHARFGRPERTAAIWARPSFQRSVQRAARSDRRAPQPHALLIPELDTIVQFFPLDRELPGLIRASSRRTAGRLLGHALGGPHADRVPLRHVTLLRYRPGRKALLRYELAEEAAGSLYTKVFAGDRATWLDQLGRRLVAGGIPTPEPLTRLQDVSGIVHREAPGVPLATLDGDDLLAALTPTGRVLGALHAMAWSGPLPRARPSYIPLAASARTVALLLPDLARRVDALASRLGEALAAVNGSTGLIHGDFYDDQVLVDGGTRIALLDFDEARQGDPLSDIGNATAHLAARAADPAAADLQREALLEGYPGGRSLDRGRVALFEAAAGLEMSVGPFRRLQPDWPQAVERLVALAEARAEIAFASRRWAVHIDSRTAASRTEGATIDTALPRLTDLLDGAQMAQRFAAVLERPVERIEASIVRHKRGRRCAIRYDVRTSANGTAASDVRFYGKVWASARGPRVYETLKSLTQAGGHGLPRFPRPVAFFPDLGVMIQSEVRGLPIVPSLLVGDRGVAEALADGLHALHASRACLPRRHLLADELAPLTDRTARLAGDAPELAPLAQACLAAVEGAAGRSWTWREMPIHRDLYHDQVVISPTGLGFLDLDDAAMGEPAVDVANFLAHLRLLALQDGTADEPLAEVEHAFRRRSHRLDAAMDARLVRMLEGATLLRLAEIHRPRADGDRVAAGLLRCAWGLLARDDARVAVS